MKLLNISGIKELINYIISNFYGKYEVITDAPKIYNINCSDGELVLDVQMNKYYIINGNVDKIVLTDNISQFDLYSHKETYSYIQFTTGSEPKLPAISKKISKCIQSNFILEPNTDYIFEIKYAGDYIMIKNTKYSN